MMRAIRYLVVVCALAACPASSSRAQSTPPAAPPAQPASAPTGTHPDFSGTWALDRSISVDPAQITLTPSAGNRSQNRSRRGGSGGFGGRGLGGGFGGGGGGSRASEQNGTPALAADDQARLKALTDELKTASASLVISQHDPSFVVNDALDHAQFFQTDGSTADNHVGGATISSSTHWDGARVITECSLASGLTLVYTYTLLPASNQLVVRVNHRDGDKLKPFAPDVKLVYNRKS